MDLGLVGWFGVVVGKVNLFVGLVLLWGGQFNLLRKKKNKKKKEGEEVT